MFVFELLRSLLCVVYVCSGKPTECCVCFNSGVSVLFKAKSQLKSHCDVYFNCHLKSVSFRNAATVRVNGLKSKVTKIRLM